MGIDLLLPIPAIQGDHSQQPGARTFIPWALLHPCPFQQFKVTILGCKCARPFIPLTLIRPCPFQ